MTQRRIQPPAAVVEALRACRSAVLVTHINPDGDGLGSEAALARALESRGVRVAVANSDPTPAPYAFLGLEARRAVAGPFELAVALDCPVAERLGGPGLAAFQAAGRRLVLDHHLAKVPYGDLTWIEDKASSTGEMMEALLPALGVAPDPAAATAMYAALVNDTGCFRHGNTDAHVFATALRLTEAGADVRGVHRRLLEERPLRQVRLQARVLDGMRILAGGRAALVAVRASDLEAFGATWEDTDGLAEQMRAIEGVEVGAMLREEGPRAAKLSLRSKYAFDANAFAARWGGGGHAKAAGATLPMGFEAAVQELAGSLEAAVLASPRP